MIPNDLIRKMFSSAKIILKLLMYHSSHNVTKVKEIFNFIIKTIENE